MRKYLMGLCCFLLILGSSMGVAAHALEPKQVQQIEFGTHQGYVMLTEGSGTVEVAAPAQDTRITAADVEETHQFYGLYEPDGAFQRQRESINGRVVSLYPGQLNYLSVTETFEKGFGSANRLQVFRLPGRTLESKELLWETELPFYTERPHVLLADMNGDGVMDVIVSGWFGVSVFDSATHQLIQSIHQSEIGDTSRKRGFVTARDLTGNGFPDLVIMGVYPWTIDVIYNTGTALRKGWVKIYDDHIESAKIITRYPRAPVTDLTGDGKLELLYNIWNERGDGAWHVKALDARTGQEVLDLPETYLVDALDVNGDGKQELFVSTPSGLDVPEYSNLQVLSAAGKQLLLVKNAKWVRNFEDSTQLNEALHGGHNPVEKYGREYLVTDPSAPRTQQEFFVSQRQNSGMGTEVLRYTLNGRDARFALRCPAGSQVELLRTRGGALFCSWDAQEAQPEPLRITGKNAQILNWGKHVRQSVTPFLSYSGNTSQLLLPTNIGQIVRYDRAQGAQYFTKQWSAEGFGAAYQYDLSRDYGVVGADFTGDGQLETAVRVDGARGAGIRMLRADGSMLWQTDFPLFPSGPIKGHQGCLSFYACARVKKKMVLIVSGQRNVQHTGIVYGLDGATGKILWSRDRVISQKEGGGSGLGGYPLTVKDINHDGVDEILCGYGNALWVARADTGEVLAERFMTGMFQDLWIREENGAGWLSQLRLLPVGETKRATQFFLADGGESHGVISVKKEGRIVRFFRRTGRTILSAFADVFHKQRTYHPGNMTLDWGNLERTHANRSGQCVFTAQGRVLVAEAAERLSDGAWVMQAIDPFSGKLLGAEFVCPGRSSATLVACDWNGDGVQEIFYSSGKTIFIFHFDGTRWTIAWRTTLDGTIRSLVCDEASRTILVATDDGLLTVFQ